MCTFCQSAGLNLIVVVVYVCFCVWGWVRADIQHQCSHGNGCSITGVSLVYLQTESLSLFLTVCNSCSLSPPCLSLSPFTVCLFSLFLSLFLSSMTAYFSGANFVSDTTQDRFKLESVSESIFVNGRNRFICEKCFSAVLSDSKHLSVRGDL